MDGFEGVQFAFKYGQKKHNSVPKYFNAQENMTRKVKWVLKFIQLVYEKVESYECKKNYKLQVKL